MKIIGNLKKGDISKLLFDKMFKLYSILSQICDMMGDIFLITRSYNMVIFGLLSKAWSFFRPILNFVNYIWNVCDYHMSSESYNRNVSEVDLESNEPVVKTSVTTTIPSDPQTDLVECSKEFKALTQPTVFYSVTSFLGLRSQIQMSRVCKKFHDDLSAFLEERKNEVFPKIKVTFMPSGQLGLNSVDIFSQYVFIDPLAKYFMKRLFGVRGAVYSRCSCNFNENDIEFRNAFYIIEDLHRIEPVELDNTIPGNIVVFYFENELDLSNAKIKCGKFNYPDNPNIIFVSINNGRSEYKQHQVDGLPLEAHYTTLPGFRDLIYQIRLERKESLIKQEVENKHDSKQQIVDHTNLAL